MKAKCGLQAILHFLADQTLAMYSYTNKKCNLTP